MKALRWILFSLLAFGLGTGIALALHPPTIGIPTATASGLAADLSRIQELAAQGRCDGVRGRLRGAAAKIDSLPARTSDATIDQLMTSLDQVRGEALSACQRVADAEIAEEQKAREAAAARATTPPAATTPAPVEPTTPEPTPDPGTADPDTGGDATPPEDDTSGDGEGEGQGDGEGGSPGGVPIPNGTAIRQQLEKERKRWEKEARQIRKAWEG